MHIVSASFGILRSIKNPNFHLLLTFMGSKYHISNRFKRLRLIIPHKVLTHDSTDVPGTLLTDGPKFIYGLPVIHYYSSLYFNLLVYYGFNLSVMGATKSKLHTTRDKLSSPIIIEVAYGRLSRPPCNIN